MKVLDATTSQVSPRLPLDREWAEHGELDIFDGVLFLWRYRYLIVAVTLTALCLGFLVTKFLPKQYTATSTVFVNTPRAQNPLAPEVLSIEGLERLASSELVVAQVSAELEKRRLTDATRQVFDFKTRLYKSSDPQKPYLPLLGLSAVASAPELSREAANIWASALITETTKLSAVTRTSAVDFVVTEYPKAAERLTEQERAMEVLKREHGQALQSTKTAASVSLKEAQLKSREQVIVDLEDKRNRLSVDLKETEATVAALEQALKQTPPMIVVSKAISDDALWDSAAKNGGTFPPDLLNLRLRTQEINPVHLTLTQKAADARVRRSELLAKRPALAAQIEQSRREAMALRASLGYGTLSIANLELRQQTEVAAKGREVDGARANFKKLEERIGDAQIVKAEKDSSLTMGASAELPSAPSGPKVLRTVAIAGGVGFLIALVAAWISERARKAAVA
ncbi:MAG TPA: Wzz/FepE/Etk N-terminal domain-containing protein [Vicinamibacterales bacterium]|nr:Wzz/FepE/Etk N-terminal domain-containing protein [Vicinamibacterales bacterium]